MISKITSLVKEAEIHESLGSHIHYSLLPIYDNEMTFCKSCFHLILPFNDTWKVVDEKQIKSFSDFSWLRECHEYKKVIKVYEKLKYLYCPSFAFYITRDVTKKATKISRHIASLDEVYDFHYKNEIDGRSTPEAAKEFQRLLKKRLEF